MAKKFLVVLITAAMLLTVVPLATFAEDTATTTATTAETVTSTAPATAPTVPYADIFGTPYESTFVKLHLMGLFTGYPDQTFKPDRPVTRSEFLAVTIRALNFDKYTSGFKGATQYPDTAIDHWATGYINMGTAFGIIKGYPDGTFRPDSNVSYAEACTMLVRMLGYTQYLTPVTPGGGTEDWFANFVKMAVAMGDPTGYGMEVHPPLLDLPEGILTGVQNFSAASPASRGDLAIMTYNAIYVYPLGQFEWHSNGPVPGGMYFPTNSTLAENMGYHEMETFVTNAPDYDIYAATNQLELFEGWTVQLMPETKSTLPDGTFIPYGQGWTDPNGKFWGNTDPALIAEAFDLEYPTEFSPVHRLYNIPSGAIWVGGKPANLVDLIGKPVRVIYNGDEPTIGQDPFSSPSDLWYIRILPNEVLNRKIAANKVGLEGYYFPGKTVGEIYADNKLTVYQADTTSKTLENLSIDPRAVIFLEDTQVENYNVMLVKDADIKVVRGLAEIATYKDYEGHMYGYTVTANRVLSILAKVWPGHIIKDVMPTGNSTAVYDKWGRIDEWGTLSFSFTDDNTFNKRVQTPYPTAPSFMTAWVEDDAKFILSGALSSNWNWYQAAFTAYSALDWYATNYYPVGTVRLAPIKYGQGAWSVIKFEGAENTKTGVLQQIYRTKDQWGNDWVTAVQVGGTVYNVLSPGRGEFPAIAASITGSSAAPSAPVGQVGAVESGATFASNISGDELVFNNLWNEENPPDGANGTWVGQSVDLSLNADGLVRYMCSSAASSTTSYEDYGMVTRANMTQDSSGYHLSLDIMMPNGSIQNFPLTEDTWATIIGWVQVYEQPDLSSPWYWEPYPYTTLSTKILSADFSYYKDHNRGDKFSAKRGILPSDYPSVYETWRELQYLVRDMVRITKPTDDSTGGWHYRFQELAVNPATRYNTVPSEGFVKQVGPTFDGTVFTLKDVNNTELVYNFPKASWGPQTIEESMVTTPFLAAKDSVTTPWSGSGVNAPTVQAGTAIYDATMPPPNSPTPDGNITIKKMADLQREMYVQVFFQPAYESANPTMIDWMLVNGEKVPVVKFVVIRPLMGGALKNVTEWPAADQIITGADFVGVNPQTPSIVKPIWKQFNQTLDLVRSNIWVYNTDTRTFILGSTYFTTTVYQNDTLNFVPMNPLPDALPGGTSGPVTLPDGHYLVNATAYDAFTGGTQSLNFSWTFTSQHADPVPVGFSGTIVGADGFTGPMEGVWVYASWGDTPKQHVATTDASGNWAWSHAFAGYYSGVDVTFTIDATKATNIPPAPPSGWVTPWPVQPGNYVEHASYEGGSFPGLNFTVTFTPNPT